MGRKWEIFELSPFSVIINAQDRGDGEEAGASHGAAAFSTQALKHLFSLSSDLRHSLLSQSRAS